MTRLVLRLERVRGVLVLARRLARDAPGPLARVRVFAVALTLGARWILRRPSPRLRAVRLRSLGGRPFAVSDYGELQVMRDIVADEEYALPGVAPSTIVDLGANVGVAAAWFRVRYPEARIVAVEPDPATFAKLARNIGGDPAVTLVHAAVGRESGEVALSRAPGYSVASSVAVRPPDAAETVRVPAVTLDEVCAEAAIERIDLLKLDVEGAELDVVEGCQALDAVGTIVGEAHPPVLGERVGEFFERLRDFDVERRSESDQSIMFVARRRAATGGRSAPAAATTPPA